MHNFNLPRPNFFKYKNVLKVEVVSSGSGYKKHRLR